MHLSQLPAHVQREAHLHDDPTRIFYLLTTNFLYLHRSVGHRLDWIHAPDLVLADTKQYIPIWHSFIYGFCNCDLMSQYCLGLNTQYCRELRTYQELTTAALSTMALFVNTLIPDFRTRRWVSGVREFDDSRLRIAPHLTLHYHHERRIIT